MHEVFLSYASPDREWARRLHRRLVGRGISVFFDQASLRDGEGWENQLEAGLKKCKHLVCLWSAHAHASPWVQSELAFYRIDSMSRHNPGRLLMVRLDDKANAFGSLQQIELAEVKAAYADPTYALSEEAWRGLVDRLSQDLKLARAGVSVPLVLFTLTQAQAAMLGPAERQQLQARLGLDEAAMAARYGSDQLAWKPFGGDTMGTLLEQARHDLNAWLTPETLGWEFPIDAFWTDAAAAREFARRMANCRLGAIVIDPVAMLVPGVQSRLGFFSACLQCENVAIIAVPTAPVPAYEHHLRNWLGEFASTLFDTYLEPPRAAAQLPSARYGVGLSDAAEVRRLLQRSVANFLRQTPPDGGGPKNPFTSF